MTIERQIEASAVDIVLKSTKNVYIIRQLGQKIGIQQDYEIFLEFFKNFENVINSTLLKNTEKSKIINGLILCTSDVKTNNNQSNKKHGNGYIKSHSKKYDKFFDMIVSSTLKAITLWRSKSNKNNNKSTSLFETVVDAFEENIQDKDVKTLEKVIQKKAKDKIMNKLHGAILSFCGQTHNKTIMQQILKKQIHDEGELTQKISSMIEDKDLNEAFYTIIEQSPKILYKVLNLIKKKSELIRSNESVDLITNILKESVVQVAKEVHDSELKTIFTINRNKHTIQNLLTESLALARALSLN